LSHNLNNPTSRTLNLMSKIIEKLCRIESYEEPEVKGQVYRLHFNENLHLPDDYYYKLLDIKLSIDDVKYYTEPLNKSFNKLLANFLNLHENQVFTTCGADEALRLILQLSLHGYKKVLIIEPTYGLVKILAKVMNLNVDTAVVNDKLEIDIDDITERRDVDVIYICNPNNPTGHFFNISNLEKIITNVDSLIVIDEAYIEFSGKDHIPLIHKYDNVVLIRTFSKAWGLAGLRVGYVLGSEKIIQILKKISLPHNIPYPSIIYVSKALKLKNYVEESIRSIIQVREFMIRELKSMVDYVYPSVTNFITFKISNAEIVWKKLLERGFLTRILNNNPYCKDCIRVTVPPLSIAKVFLTTLRQILEELR